MSDETWETEEASEVADNESKFDDLSFGDTLVEDLPPAAGSLYAEVIGKLIELSEGNDGWLQVQTGGREPNSVQTGLQSAARTLGVRIKTRTRPNDDGGKDVFVALNTEEVDEEE